MKSEYIKLELIEWLAKMEDKGLLQSLFFLKKANESSDRADDLTAEQKSKVEQGLQDIKAYRTVSREKVRAKYGRKTKN